MGDLVWSPAVLAVALAVFVAVLLLFEGGYLLWRQRFGKEARRVQARLKALADERERAEQEFLRQRVRETSALQSWFARFAVSGRIERLLRQAELSWSPDSTLLASLAAGALAAALVAGPVDQPWATAVLLGLAAGAAPWVHVLWRRERRMARLQQQLPQALDLMVRALRAGHAFSSALQMVGDEMPDPIASEFRLVHDEVNFGMNLPQAFGNLIARVPLTDLRYFVVAVLIQREAGGNLTELLGNLSRLIRQRQRLLARVRVLSSEGRLSGWILVVLPFALGGLLNFFNPQFMQPLWTDPLGLAMVNWMLGLMALGMLLMRKIVRIRV